MLDVAILGGGPIGAALAHRLAERGRLRQLLIVDPAADVASGIALDIQQSGPILSFETTLSGTSDILAAAGAGVVVVADRAGAGEWSADEAIAVIARLLRAGAAGAVVCAGTAHAQVLEGAFRAHGVSSRDRLIGTAPAAMIGAVRSLAGLELGLSSVDVEVVGRPPALVVGWSAATVAGSPIGDRLAAHQLLRISNALPRLWPPGPHAIASATAPVVEALRIGSRRLHSAMTVLDGELGARGVAAMLPLELAHGRIRSRVIPTLSDQERTALVNGLQR